MKNPLAEKGIIDCWNKIGVSGDGSCKELVKVVHCKNCFIYTSAGRLLLDREPPADYLNDWSDRLAKPKSQKRQETVSVVIFRLLSRFFAIDTKNFYEVTDPAIIHTIPHRTGKVLLGIVNIRGEIHPCVSMNDLLQLPKSDPSQYRQGSNPMFAVVEHAGERWAFPVDQVCGIFELDRAQLSQTSKSGMILERAFSWQGNDVFYLDSSALFADLKSRLT